MATHNQLETVNTREQSWGIPRQDMEELKTLAGAGEAILAKATKRPVSGVRL